MNVAPSRASVTGSSAEARIVRNTSPAPRSMAAADSPAAATRSSPSHSTTTGGRAPAGPSGPAVASSLPGARSAAGAASSPGVSSTVSSCSSANTACTTPATAIGSPPWLTRTLSLNDAAYASPAGIVTSSGTSKSPPA